MYGNGALAVGEVGAAALAQLLEKMRANGLGKLGVGVAGEYLDLFTVGNHF